MVVWPPRNTILVATIAQEKSPPLDKKLSSSISIIAGIADRETSRPLRNPRSPAVPHTSLYDELDIQAADEGAHLEGD